MVTARNTFGRSSLDNWQSGLAIAHTTQDGERGREGEARAREGGGGVAERVECKYIRWA